MKKILIIKPSSLGDILHALPVATALSRQVPGALIDWVVRPEYAELLEGHLAVDRVFLFDREKWSKASRILQTVPGVLSLLRSLRAGKYDAVLDLQGLFRSGLLAFLSGSRERFGFENAREFAPLFYNRKVEVPDMQIHAIERNALFLKDMGLDAPEVVYDVSIPGAAEEYIESLLAEEKIETHRPFIVLNPNARWETKRWFPDRWAQLADGLSGDLGAAVALVGGPSEEEEARRIRELANTKPHNFAGRTTLMQLAALLRRADLMVTCDSGPMHLAAAVGAKVLALFGPTDPVRTGPYGTGHRILHAESDCSPCFERSCPERTLSCMGSITVDEVLQEVKEMLTTILT